MTAYCSNCGTALPPAARFCSVCGTVVAGMPPAGYAPPPYYPTRLTRPLYDRKLAGVCSGFAQTYNWDVGLVRILSVVAGIFLFPLPEIAYLACWIGIPEQPIALPPPPQQM